MVVDYRGLRSRANGVRLVFDRLHRFSVIRNSYYVIFDAVLVYYRVHSSVKNVRYAFITHPSLVR